MESELVASPICLIDDMKNFHCDFCDNLIYFENVQCSNCAHELAFVPELRSMTAIESVEGDLWKRAVPPGKAASVAVAHRKCRNYTAENVCNWTVEAADPNPYCISCRLTETIPDLSQDGNRESWFKLENAKRRLIYSLLELRLPIEGKIDHGAKGILFRFMADDPQATSGQGKVLTGHDDGTIVINIAEADDAERERRRVQMREPYRTLLGHLRHEIGHYYWDVLIRDSARLDAYRALFGDERADYAASLKHHYDNGAPAHWQDSFVSTYATSHPWEDWAETWAHYLHITDALETADDSGLSLRPRHRNEPELKARPSPDNPARRQFEEIIERWLPLTYVLNNLNRGLGLSDAYPFVLSVPALEKLRFVHETVNLGSTDR